MIAAIGDLLLDISIAPSGPLADDDDCDARISIGGGGQAGNFCAWAASLGEPATLITSVGGDAIGRRLVAELEASGVKVIATIGPQPTGAIAAIAGIGGRRALARQAGAGPAEVEPQWLDGARLLHISGYTLYRQPEAMERAAALARERGALMSVDLASAADLRAFGPDRAASILMRMHPDLLFATEPEAAALPAPVDRLAQIAITKLGAGGCRALGRHVPAPRVDVVDGTGAGDAFAAAFCVAYLDGALPWEAAGRAVLVGARAVTVAGARP